MGDCYVVSGACCFVGEVGGNSLDGLVWLCPLLLVILSCRRFIVALFLNDSLCKLRNSLCVEFRSLRGCLWGVF